MKFINLTLLSVTCLAVRRFDIFVGLPMDLNDMYWLGEVLPQARPYTFMSIMFRAHRSACAHHGSISAIAHHAAGMRTEAPGAARRRRRV